MEIYTKIFKIKTWDSHADIETKDFIVVGDKIFTRTHRSSDYFTEEFLEDDAPLWELSVGWGESWREDEEILVTREEVFQEIENSDDWETVEVILPPQGITL